jgi:hypothetical protein
MSNDERVKRTVFYTVAAQPDNLGDIEIRATLLDWLAERGSPVRAYAGGMPEAYLAAFDAPGNVTWVHGKAAFEMQLIWASVRGRSAIVFAPGPQTLSDRPSALGKTLLNLANVIMVRLAGGPALAVGRSFRGSASMAKRLERLLVGHFDYFAVRDDVSAGVLAAPLALEPDLAFAQKCEGRTPAHNRRSVAVSLRGDRPIDEAGLNGLIEALRSVDVDVVLVTQVKRDDAQHRALAETYGLRAVLWENASHETQFRRARDAYSEARFVISNRLHALLLAAQEGSLPVAIRDAQWDKTRSTLQPWLPLSSTGEDLAARDGRSWMETPTSKELQDFAIAHEAARERLLAMKRELQSWL